MSTKTATESIWEWIQKRGILFVLTQTPMIALVVGYFLRWTDYATATAFTVILAFVLLPVWIVIRKNRSDDPDEPAHHFHRYAFWALVPYVVYNLSRMPFHYLIGIVFWDHWYDFGAELTGLPVDQWSSLLPGTLLHSLQGYVLALGFYVLYKRHSLLNSMVYVFVFLSVIYSWTYPTFILVDYQPPAKWFFVVWWAHFWMAVAAWFVPRWLKKAELWSRLRSNLAKATLVLVLLVVYFLPVGFVFWRVPTWQFPMQRAIDEESFQTVDLVLQNGPALVSVEAVPGQRAGLEAHYEFGLRFGPRIFTDYIKARKCVDAGPIRISGHLIHQGEVVAWCAEHVEMLETPNNLLSPAEFFPALQRMEYTDIAVSCVGPAEAASRLGDGARLQLRWAAEARLLGDRERTYRTFGQRTQVASLEISDEAVARLAQHLPGWRVMTAAGGN